MGVQKIGAELLNVTVVDTGVWRAMDNKRNELTREKTICRYARRQIEAQHAHRQHHAAVAGRSDGGR